MKKAIICLSGVLIVLALVGGCMVSRPGRYGQTTLIIGPAIPAPVFAVKPGLILVEGVPGVYFVSGFNVYFYLNTWYYFCQGKWFSGASHNGPWVYVEPNRMPAPLGRIPPGHLKSPPGQVKDKTVPPGQAKDKPGRGPDKDDDKPGRGHGRGK